MNDVEHAHPAFAGVAKFAESVAIKTSAVGIKVFNHLNKYLGRIEDIVIANRIAYVVFSVGGIFGLGKTQCMAPWKSLHRDRTRKVYVLHPAPAQIGRAPRVRHAKFLGHSRDQWSRHLWALPTRSDATLQALLRQDISESQMIGRLKPANRASELTHLRWTDRLPMSPIRIPYLRLYRTRK